ncbi:hypothetical protein ROLI_024970 [Roseobacter fucihabitans]|uniref:CENP-V/GFA domain-containing protein n=1 Tax=Roseobacter fucihabitans TaxID=1537242 RepID=A0ABZ2BVH7_9RHOB|nr:DUF6151 family protein [Roseobacter litoralis]MBC6965199.1 hypothetical protein [Roseobacter litoralis]
MTDDVDFSCTCGTLKGVLHDVSPETGCHLICYCQDCRAFARHMGRLGALEPGGGTPLVQVLPAKIEITDGAEHIACLRMGPKGLHRWYAACCNTPLANTVGTPKMPLAGMWRPLFARIDAFGPVTTQGFTKMALPEMGRPRKDRGLARMMGGLIKRSLSAYMSGTARKSPFFEQNGTPVTPPQVLSDTDRKAAYSE